MIRSYRRAAAVEELKAMTQGKGVTRDFLNNYGRRLERLLGDEEEA
jgi:hypothetical protein